MFAKTVAAPVDRHAAALVDAINEADTDFHTLSCCSGHLAKPGIPYVAIAGTDWEFVKRLLSLISAVNRSTAGRTTLSLTEFSDGHIVGAIRFVVYPWFEVGEHQLMHMYEHTGPPPRRLVHLWWEEIDELARLVREADSEPSTTIGAHFERACTQGKKQSNDRESPDR